jgi:hypothetical protein
VGFALEKALKLEDGRKELVFFGDGVDTRSESASKEDTLELARRRDVPIDSIYFHTSQDRNRQVSGLLPGMGSPPTQVRPECGADLECGRSLSILAAACLSMLLGRQIWVPPSK